MSLPWPNRGCVCARSLSGVSCQSDPSDRGASADISRIWRRSAPSFASTGLIKVRTRSHDCVGGSTLPLYIYHNHIFLRLTDIDFKRQVKILTGQCRDPAGTSEFAQASCVLWTSTALLLMLKCVLRCVCVAYAAAGCSAHQKLAAGCTKRFKFSLEVKTQQANMLNCFAPSCAAMCIVDCVCCQERFQHC